MTNDYVAQAKRLLANAGKAALVIVPLAVAVPAHAAPIVLPTSNFACSIFASDSQSSASCTSGAGVDQLSDPGDGIQGLKFFTTSPIHLNASSSGSAAIRFQVTGPITGGSLAIGTFVPIAWDFDFDPDTGGPTPIGYNLAINSASNGAFIFNASGGGGAVSGSGGTTIGGAALGGTVTFFVDFNLTFSGGGPVFLSVPHNSIDVNPSAAVGAVPEPATGGVIASALGALGLWLRRRRHRG